MTSIGLHPNKSKTIKSINIPDRFFADFLRGCFDGDGYSYSYWDKRWKSSFMLYMGFASASRDFLNWIEGKIRSLYQIKGAIKNATGSTLVLVYAKNSSLGLIKKMYYKNNIIYLKRKKFKINQALCIINKMAGMAKLVHAQP